MKTLVWKRSYRKVFGETKTGCFENALVWMWPQLSQGYKSDFLLAEPMRFFAGDRGRNSKKIRSLDLFLAPNWISLSRVTSAKKNKLHSGYTSAKVRDFVTKISTHLFLATVFLLRFFRLSLSLSKGGYTCDFNRAIVIFK